MKRYMLPIMILVIGFGCKPDEPEVVTGNLSLSFKASFGDESFVTLKAFPYSGKQSIKWNKFDFILTGVELMGSSRVEFKDAVMIDLTGSGGSHQISLQNIPEGTYTGIKFFLGVIPELNKKLPKDFSSKNPLSNNSLHWDAWDSYIFTRLEGVLDTGGTQKFDFPFAIHTGMDVCLTSKEYNKTLVINGTTPASIDFNIDLKKVFTENGTFFNIIASPLNHNPSNLDVLKGFSARLIEAMQLKN